MAKTKPTGTDPQAGTAPASTDVAPAADATPAAPDVAPAADAAPAAPDVAPAADATPAAPDVAPAADAAPAAPDVVPAADAAPAAPAVAPAADAAPAAPAVAHALETLAAAPERPRRREPWDDGLPFRKEGESRGAGMARADDALYYLTLFAETVDGVVGATSGRLSDVVRNAAQAVAEMRALRDAG